MMTDQAWKALGFAVLCGTSLGAGRLDAQAAPPEAAGFPSGFSIGGMGVAMDRHNREAQAAPASLTQDKSRYLMVFDLFPNLGVARVEGHLNIRKEPRRDAPVLGRLQGFGGCTILGVRGGWYQVRSGGIEGYVSGQYLEVGQAARTLAIQHMKLRLKVEAKALRVRKGPGTDQEILGVVYEGDQLDVAKDMGSGWARVYVEGGEGYVYAPGNATLAYTIPEAVKAESGIRQRVVDYAIQFVGNQYQWGGTNPYTGADCSGFVQYVMGHGANVRLNRTSREQAMEGRPVSYAQIQPGDLVFYASGGVINHVAVYIGGGKIVHAANKKSGIKISNWNYRHPAALRSVIAQ